MKLLQFLRSYPHRKITAPIAEVNCRLDLLVTDMQQVKQQVADLQRDLENTHTAWLESNVHLGRMLRDLSDNTQAKQATQDTPETTNV